LQKPTTIRIMLLLVYFQIVMFVMGIASLVSNWDKLSENGALNFLSVYFIGYLVSLAGMIWTIRKRKLFPATLISLVLALCGILMNMSQFLAAVVVVLLFMLKSTRDYFRGDIVSEAPAQRVKTAVNEEGGEEDAKAALEDPDEVPAQPLVKLRKDPEITIREATADDAETVFTLMRMAFEEYRTATPPSSALDETEESVIEALRSGDESAAILYEDDTATAMVRFKYDGDAICFFRLSVVPHRRRRGYARQLVKWIEKQGVAKGMKISRCKVRQSVQNNLVLYQNMGYEVIDQELVVRPTGTVKALTMEKKLWE